MSGAVTLLDAVGWSWTHLSAESCACCLHSRYKTETNTVRTVKVLSSVFPQESKLTMQNTLSITSLAGAYFGTPSSLF